MWSKSDTSAGSKLACTIATKAAGGLGVLPSIPLKILQRRGRGYKNLHYLLLKAQRMAVTRTEFITIRKAA